MGTLSKTVKFSLYPDIQVSGCLVVTVRQIANLSALFAIMLALSDTPIKVGRLQPRTSPSDNYLLVIIFR